MKLGAVLGERFEVQSLAGRGGMGAVYRALDRSTGGTVALKVLLELEPSAAARFQREAELLSSLHHPAIVRHLAEGLSPEGEPYLVMEWLEGEDLAKRLSRARPSVLECVELGLCVVDALGAAHAQQIVHRDLKPHNLFLLGEGYSRVKLLDFGLARFAYRGAALTRTGALLGTPAYMAPEQARGDRELTDRVDIFALGCTLFHCLAGGPPFAGGQVAVVLARVLFEEAPRVAALRAEVPAPLDELVAQMLAKDPAERPGYEEVRAVLESLLAHPSSWTRAPSRKPAAPALTRTERRVQCAVLAGPVLPTTLVGEDLVTRSTNVLSELEREAVRRGGRLSPLADGSVAALFSGGVATDLLRQAARFALALRGCAPDAAIAVALGPGQDGNTPVGEVLERAAALLRSAVPRQAARLDASSASLLESRFDVRLEGDSYLLLGERGEAEAGRSLLGSVRACVGRERELASLEALFDECVQEPAARAVTLVAPAGAGKSRVRFELLRRVAADGAACVLLAAGDPLQTGAPHALLSGALRRHFGLHAGEPAAQQWERLEGQLAQSVPAPQRASVSEWLGELVGVPSPHPSDALRAARNDARESGRRRAQATSVWLAAECAERPVVLVLEDLHWGDLASVRLVDALLELLREKPFFVLATARPEVHERFPRLFAGHAAEEVTLQKLSRRACERLIRDVLGRDVAAEAVERLYVRSEGNAFFLEELLRAVARGMEDQLPDSVLAMTQARLEALPGRERQVLRAASVFGETFWLGGVAALLGEEPASLESVLDTILSREEVLCLSSECRYAGEKQYTFRHALTRQATYAMLTPADCGLGHRLAAQWLAACGERSPLVLARHFDQSDEPARAVPYFLDAADAALQWFDLEGGLERLADARRCGASGTSLGVVKALEAEIHWWRARPQETMQLSREAMVMLEEGSTFWYRSAALQVMLSVVFEGHAQFAEAVRTLQRVEPRVEAAASFGYALWMAAFFSAMGGVFDVARAFLEQARAFEARMPAPDPTLHGFLLCVRCHLSELADGDPYRQLRCAEEAIASFASVGDSRGLHLAHMEKAKALEHLGFHAEAAAAWRFVQAEAEAANSAQHGAVARLFLGETLLLAGDEAAGREATARSLEEMETYADHVLRGLTWTRYAARLLRDGDPSGAERYARRAEQVLTAAPPYLVLALAERAEAELRAGRPQEALATLELAQERAAALRGVGPGELHRALLRAEVLRALDAREAPEALRAAQALLEERARRIEDPAARESFLRRVPRNARLRSLGEGASGAG